MDKKRLAICAFVENEAAYLQEWLAYHVVVGVEHFVLYDNASTDDPAAAIRTSPFADRVTLVHWLEHPGQLTAYRNFIDAFATGFEWVAFLDVDEFLLPLHSDDIGETLDGMGNAGAVLVHRRVFGPGAWETPPPGLVIENYDRRAPDDFSASRHVGTIARCAELQDVTQNPHEFRVNGPVFNTAGDLAPNRATQAQACFQNLVINHYYTRSRQDWLAKVERNNAAADATMPKDEAGLFDHLAAVCQVHDTTIQAFVPAVRAQLAAEAEAPSEVFGQPPEPEAAPIEAAFTATLMESAAESLRYRLDQPAVPAQPVAGRVDDRAAAWVARGPDAQEKVGGLGLVFRDRSRSGEHWLAALRGGAASAIDPAFLLDEFDRIYDFPSGAEARAACDAALAQRDGH